MTHKRYLVPLRWGSFQDGSDMSTTRDLINDMYCILLRCGSFQNESGVFTKSTREVDHSKTMMCIMEAHSLYVTTWELNAVSPSIFQFGPPAGVQSYIYIFRMRQHMFINLTNYMNCAKTRFVF